MSKTDFKICILISLVTSILLDNQRGLTHTFSLIILLHRNLSLCGRDEHNAASASLSLLTHAVEGSLETLMMSVQEDDK